MEPDKTTLTGFTPKTQEEIDRHLFAAKTGGLVSIGPAAFWELFYAAKAWHQHLSAIGTGSGGAEAQGQPTVSPGGESSEPDEHHE